MALAPMRDLFSVPSRSISTRSTRVCSSPSGQAAPHQISVLTYSTPSSTPCPDSAAFVAIAQLNGFARAGRSATRHSSATRSAAFQHHIGFNGGVAARIKEFHGR